MKKFRYFFTAVAMFLAALAYGQNITVTGTVIDASTNEPIPYASLQLKGTSTGVSSDADGRYSMSVPANGVIVFSSVGYRTEEIAVSGRGVINVAMHQDSEFLDETIVVAYGVQKKSSFVGSATQISGEKLKKMQSTNISKSLEGEIAGLQIASSSGTPGSSASIQIRGFGSVSAETAPLIVVDGVPYEGSLNSIPSMDINSLTVLKDAAANSMYGARGSNGVIIITTKGGTAGKVNIIFDAKVGVNSRAVPAYDIITSPADYYEMTWESIRNSAYYTGVMNYAQAGLYASGSMISNFLGPYNVYKGIADGEIINPGTGRINPDAKELKWSDNWNKDVFRPGVRQEYNVSASGGSDKTQGYLSVSYLNDKGYVYNSGFTRISVRGKVDQTIGKFIKAGLNIAYSNTNQTRYNDSEGSNYANLFMFSQMVAPIYPIYLYDADGVRQYSELGETLYDWGETGRAYHEMDRYTALNANQLITWTPTFGNHSLNVLFGHETKSDSSYYLYGHMTNFVDSSVSDFANATVYQDLTSATSKYFLEGVFGRAEYNYSNRYYLSASYRMDGSSRFAKDVRWGSFWSVGASWDIRNESFLQNVDWVNGLRIKASYGTQGNDNIGLTRVYENLYRIDRVNGEASLTQTFRAAPDVTWEKSNNFNVGAEARFLDRFAFNVEYFIKETKDMIYYRPLAPSQGSPTTQLVNDMDMVNKGVEFEVSADIFKNRNFSWNIALNGTHYKNKITKLPSDYPAEGKQYGNFWRETGGSLYNYYLYEWAGVDPENGLPQYYKYTDILDDAGNPTGEEERTIVNSTSQATYRKIGKTPIPDLYGGFSTSLNFFGFDLSASFAYQIGGYTLDTVYQSLMSGGDAGSNWHKDIFTRWTPANTSTDVPRVQMNYQEANALSDRWLISSSYFSIRNVTFGYTIPEKASRKLKLQSIRVYLTGDNLFYTSARRGMDVRKSFSGANGFTYSALRTVSAGLTVTF